MAITLAEAAKMAGVFRSTASRVLSGRIGVSPLTRERMLRIM
ncbi:LacI family DNA-binding transcriptional regulator [bacterium]|nr:LacI family DNA-binding transcriptional regulator [bacterium]